MSRSITTPEVALPYSRLAADYDATIGLPFFRQTREFFERLVKKYGISFRSAADIGCGTGLFARHLKLSRNVPIFAVDLSEPMLRIAARNLRGTNVLLLRQDIRSLRLPRPVDLITANFDTLNHLVRTNDLRQGLRRIFENLNPGGHFIFDLVTNCLPLGRSHFQMRRFDRPQRSMTQAVRFDPIRNLLSILVSISSPGMIKPIIERHHERVYSPQEIGRALHEAGFTIRAIHDAATLAAVKECPPRIVVVARKCTRKRRTNMYLYTGQGFGDIPGLCLQTPPAKESDSVVSAIRSLPEAKTCPTLAYAAEYERRIVEKLRTQGFPECTIEAGLKLLRKELGLPAPQYIPMTGPAPTGMREPEPGELKQDFIYTAKVLEEMFWKAEQSNDVKGMADAAERYHELLNSDLSPGPGKPKGTLQMERQRREWAETREKILRQAAPTLANISRGLGRFELAGLRRRIGEYVRQRVLMRQQRQSRGRR